MIYFQTDTAFNSSIISNQINYYLAINRGNFLQLQYDFYRHTLQIYYQLWWLAIERACTKNSKKLMSRTWLFGASWWKVIKALPTYKIVHVCFFFFLIGGAVTRIGIWLAGPVHWHRFILSLIINDNIKFVDILRKVYILIWLNICIEKQIFPRTHVSQTLTLMFLYWLIECLQVNRMCIISFCFHSQLIKKPK